MIEVCCDIKVYDSLLYPTTEERLVVKSDLNNDFVTLSFCDVEVRVKGVDLITAAKNCMNIGY